ncbi:2-C-methyl-D-erythritol 4-phosphate cytidylyltransferase [Shewanella sp. D64]|uniref:2-C-methyl-D-erythritol 4-phosphate cytidylyltransferase n=1 Tax=unclassified Shewanella TaxID=196818 RepID=UPI0022BA258D|nr:MULTISPECIES: 2-C-methyl-D-erythritol 4-phosphate cytidylyltransferase [unclassified Shewanella]MEC4728456.1 2-C-methyl-D-erythritol 4-phosphate cytidylyltransferase [Shewanella sp. D64]MEC4740446.1 2-C-methyl-D-erythritol 4-phosphate cytidylyltransferase [Shewanella sp. E94]WBJ94006.1 2-C-methyl-D-erythritol 4-phosphate cytidylyltransferase [Shewanella sp. MTB7]
MNERQDKIVAVVPAAGIGSRMGTEIPKQYLEINGTPILGLTLTILLTHPKIDKVIVALYPKDTLFSSLPQASHPKLHTVVGGGERADSVLACLEHIEDGAWALVHDAARPCLTHSDIDKLIASRERFPQGAILAVPVRDTMKRGKGDGTIEKTVCREQLWQALTPQLFLGAELRGNLSSALIENAIITDEASAMEWAGVSPGLVSGSIENIKITHPDDLRLAKLFLTN